MNAREQALGVLAEAVGVSDLDDDALRDVWRVKLTAGLDALLAARVPTPCETCGDSGTVAQTRGVGADGSVECPDCEPPHPLVVLYDALEQTRWTLDGCTGDESPRMICFPDERPLFQHKESEAP